MASFTWNGSTADWVTAADWSNGGSPGVPGGGDQAFITMPGSYVVSVGTADTLSVGGLTQSAGVLSVDGTLTLNGASTLLAGGAIDGGNTSEYGSFVNGAGSLLNQGLIAGDVDGAALQINTETFTNQGTVLAFNAGIAVISAVDFTNLSGTTLTGGVYEAKGSGAAINFYDPFGTAAIVTDDATLTVDGDGSAIFGYDPGSGYVSLEASLTSIGSDGVLNILGGYSYLTSNALTDDGTLRLGGGTLATGSLTDAAGALLIGYGIITTAIANAGTVEAEGGILLLSGGVSGGTLRTDADATMALSGSFAQPITNDGTIRAQSGLLNLSGAVTGGGGFVIQSGSAGAVTTLELGAADAGQVVFNGGFGELLLDSPGSFTGGIVGFGGTIPAAAGGTITGDSIVLEGIVGNGATLSNDTLEVTEGGARVYALSMPGMSNVGSFTAVNDGSNTTITVAGVAPQDYAFEGPYWQSKTITWSFATSNLSPSDAQFSDFLTSPGTLDGRSQIVYQDVIEMALARWAAVEGFNFVEVPDSASVDIRIGWGDLINAGLGEIGQASYVYDGDVMLPDTIVRIEDPAETGLVDDSGVIGGLVYSGVESTLYQIALHEIGHDLGMAHSTDPSAVMYPTAQGVPNQDLDASDIAGIQTLYADVACYVADTRILTVSGEVPVQALRAGDMVPGCVGGQLRRVRWVGRRRLTPRLHARPQDVQPIRVRESAFGPGLPHRDLRLSPDHAVFAAGVLVPVRYLVNGATVLREDVDEVSYVHVELADMAGQAVHDVLLAEGLPAESYLDTGNRGGFANGGGVISLMPDFAARVWDAAACAPLHIGGETVTSLRRRLLARAPALGHVLDDDPGLTLCAPGLVRPAVMHDGLTWRFVAPRGHVRLHSRTAMPAEILPESVDTRRLGVAVMRIALNGTIIPLDDPRLEGGFLPIECDGDTSWRWTDGDASLCLDEAGQLDVTLALTLPYWVNGEKFFGSFFQKRTSLPF